MINNKENVIFGDPAVDVKIISGAETILIRCLLPVFLVFAAAGRITYWQGWIFSLLILSFLVIILLLSVKKKTFVSLLQERIRIGDAAGWWDKLYISLYWPSYLLVIIIASLDAGRFGWTERLHPVIYYFGALLYIFSHVLILWAIWSNDFFSSVCRIQREKRHEIAWKCPYAFVRHPGYLGGIFIVFCTAIVLGSLWALIPACFTVLLIILRTYFEDSMLKKNLSGYPAYCGRVRYRLLPMIW